MMIVSVGARVNAQSECNMLERGKWGDQPSVPPSTFIFKTYTLVITLFHRNLSGGIGLQFFCFYTLYTLFPVIFGKIPRPGY